MTLTVFLRPLSTSASIVRFIIGMVVDYTRKRKGTLIMVTHAMSVAERFADVTITLFDGKIQRVDKLNGTL